VAAVGRESGVSLSASAETADDKATLFLDRRPAAEVLALIAGQFGFRWTRDGDGYELVQPLASKNREAALRARELREQLAAIEAKMQRVAQEATTNRDRLWKRHRDLQAEIQAARRAHLTGRLGPLHRERQAVWEQIEPRRDASLAVYRLLTPLQVQRLLEGRELVFSTSDGTMDAATAHVVRQAFATEREALPTLPSPLAEWLRMLGATPNTDVAVRVRLLDLRIHDGDRDVVGPPGREQNRLRLEFHFAAPRTGPVAMGSGGLGWIAEGEPVRPRQVSTRTTDPVLLKPVMLRFPKPDPRRTLIDPETLARAYDTFGVWPGGLLTVGEIGSALHRATGLEIVADSFVRARLAPDRFRQPRSPVAFLDDVSEALDYTWRKEGNTIFWRNARYYRDRPEEAPDRILAPWRQSVRRQGNATLNDLSALAASVTEPQARGLHQFWGWYFEGLPTLPPVRGSGGFHGSYPHLRLWAVLSPLQRRRALVGDAVLGSELTPAQRRALNEATTSIGTEDRPDIRQSDLATSLSPTQAQNGAFFIQAGSLLPENDDPLRSRSSVTT
jgi:hypothetical protein